MTVLRASVPDADEDLFFSFLLTRVVGVVAGRGGGALLLFTSFLHPASGV
jgi:hypothetical protein